MAKTKQSEMLSVKQAADRVGLSRAIVSRFCQRGYIGIRKTVEAIGTHFYLLSEQDIAWLEDRKKQHAKQN